MRLYNIYKLKQRRQELRKNPTPTESMLWKHLRYKKLGYKFRRQHSIGGYILDFVCLNKKLIIEIDGPIHEFSKNDDKARDKYFSDLGYTTMRFKNKKVDTNLPFVLKTIIQNLH